MNYPDTELCDGDRDVSRVLSREIDLPPHKERNPRRRGRPDGLIWAARYPLPTGKSVKRVQLGEQLLLWNVDNQLDKRGRLTRPLRA